MSALLLILLTTATGQNVLACADMTGDQHADVIVADERAAQLSVWIGNGRGELTHASTQSVAANPSDLDVIDFNGDGHLDVAIAHHELDQVTILTGNERGKLTALSAVGVAVKPHPHVARVVDIDSDGKLDLLIDNRAAKGLLVLPGAGHDRLDANEWSIDLDGDPYLGFAIGDINADGLPDVAAPASGRATVALQRPGQRFDVTSPGPPSEAFAVALADINGDNHLDLIVANQSQPFVQLYHGDGRGGFTLKKSRPRHDPSSPRPGASKIATGDLNADGLDDALVVSWSGEVQVVTHGEPFDTSPYKTIPHPWGIAVCDLNSDGADDVILTDGESSKTAVFLSPRL